MATFSERIIGAAKLNVGVYEEVEADTQATGQAAGVVLLSSLSGGIGSLGLGATGVGGIIAGSLAALLSWIIWAFLTYFIGTRLLPEPQTHANVGQLMRTLGFAPVARADAPLRRSPRHRPLSCWPSSRYGCWWPW